MRRLLVISSASGARIDGTLFLEQAFLEGMRRYGQIWDGPVAGIAREKTAIFPFARQVRPEGEPFSFSLLPQDRRIGPEDIRGHDLVLCGADNHEYLHVADICAGLGVRLVHIIEYTLETRLQILRLEDRGLLGTLRGMMWLLGQERRRRRAFAMADGLQANGYPAMEVYGRKSRNALMYIDNRLRRAQQATDDDMAARRARLAARLAAGGPLRLMNSGRLEPMKGAQDLVPIARRLTALGVAFEMDIFGHGSLRETIAQGIAAHGLGNRVRLHDPVDFETELLPFARQQADIFLGCNRQSDPSRTYVETMGCGVPVAGYANRMWQAILTESGGGWGVPMGQPEALADCVAQLAKRPDEIAARADRALAFARLHDFETEFDRRIAHLAAIPA